ncbi:hypothetical protein A2U01_0062875, partial [Trifolium medium]|nr:hypothetical protein [Trifolium medium]
VVHIYLLGCACPDSFIKSFRHFHQFSQHFVSEALVSEVEVPALFCSCALVITMSGTCVPTKSL